MKLPPLKALPVFEAVARLNSFSRAGDELHISQSAVSHQIKALETYLGEPLFNRNGRYLELTEEGRTFLEGISSALAQIERASEQVLGNTETQLRFAVFSSFAVRWLVPRLPLLQRTHPNLDLSLEMVNHSPTLSDRVADCFITIHRSQKAFDYELLYTEQLFAICSRPYWLKICSMLDRGPPDRDPSATPLPSLTAAEVAQFPLLSTVSIYDEKSRDWQEWFKAAGERMPDETRLQHFSHMLLALEAARHHQGIALTNDYMMENREEHQELVKLPCHRLTTGDEFFFACKTSRRGEPAIQLLKRWLVDQAVASGLRS